MRAINSSKALRTPGGAMNDSEVLVDQEYDSNEWFVTETCGRLIPAQLWEQYQEQQHKLEQITTEIEQYPWVDNRPPLSPQQEAERLVMVSFMCNMVPLATPLLNKIPRTNKSGDDV